VAGHHTLVETERAAESRIAGLELDFESMHVVSNLFRAANAVRNHMEREVLTPADLTWTAFVVLWVTWIWDRVETRVVAEETGVSKATLSGVLSTLEKRGLVVRAKSPDDGRLVLVELTPSGRRLIKQLFPKINAQETNATRLLPQGSKEDTAELLRLLVKALEQD
jgi:MarR family transcriptional regulator, organic hydroperoxide resistance regulator